MRTVAFYVAGTLILLVMVTKALTHVLPGVLAHEVNDESEALPIAVLFCAYVQFVWRPPFIGEVGRWPVALSLAAVSWLIAWLLLTLPLPSSVVTLNESFVAVGALIIYACLPRPMPYPLVLGAVLVVLVLVLNSTDFLTAQAESMVPIALMPIAFDWADRTIIDPRAEDNPGRRAVWCVLLVVVPVVARAHVHIASIHDVLHYERRATEGFLGLLLVHVYFSYLLGDRWRRRTVTGRGEQDPLPGTTNSRSLEVPKLDSGPV
jgi:hypothetical protein